MIPLAHGWSTGWVEEGKRGEELGGTAISRVRDGSGLDEGGNREIQRSGPFAIYLGSSKS